MSEWVSIKEAAERLGVSADTIRRRRERGGLAGRKLPTPQGYTWEIELPTEGRAESETEPPQEVPAEPSAQRLGDLLELELVELRERVSGLERLTSELREERDEWRGQAKRHEEAARELRILVQQAQQLAQALPATTGGEDRQGKAEAPAEPPQRDDRAAPRPGFWARLLGRSQSSGL